MLFSPYVLLYTEEKSLELMMYSHTTTKLKWYTEKYQTANVILTITSFKSVPFI